MAHEHETCTRPRGGAACTLGVVTDYCDWPDCGNEYCSPAGHCTCHCHDGKTCECGHVWPRQPKKMTKEGGTR